MTTKTEIIVHCTATPASWWEGKTTKEKVDEIALWHTRDRGWRAIGYAYLIDRDGTVAKGRDLDKDGDVTDETGAHTQGHNANSIGIALFGGHGSNENDAFEENFTPAQDRALRKLIAELKRTVPTITKISGHNQYAAKACPGFDVPSWYIKAKPPVAKPTLTAPKVGKPGPLIQILTAIWKVISGVGK